MKCRYPIRDWTPSSPDRRNRRELTEPKCWLCPAVSSSAESSACCQTALSKRAACSVSHLLRRRQATWPLLVCRGGSCVVVGKRQGPCPAIRRRWTRLRPPIQYRPSSDLRLLLYVQPVVISIVFTQILYPIEHILPVEISSKLSSTISPSSTIGISGPSSSEGFSATAVSSPNASDV